MTNEFDETTCQFVSSRGLLKSCDVRAKIPFSSCPTNLEYIEEFIKSQVPPSSSSASPQPQPPSPPVSIYVCGDAFQTFISKYVPMIKYHLSLLVEMGIKSCFERQFQVNKTCLLCLFYMQTCVVYILKIWTFANVAHFSRRK